MIERKVSFCTLGCRVNQYESDALAEELECFGIKIVPFGTPCDLAIINTCSVTAESDRKSRQMVRKVKKTSPDAKIIVTGCSLQIFPEEIGKIEGITAVVGNANKDMTAEIALKILSGDTVSYNNVEKMENAKYDNLTLSRARRARAYVKIEDGCENKCTYCIIPKGRGRVRSKSTETVVSEVSSLVKTCPEIILTGIETASWGRDFGKDYSLSGLLQTVSEIQGVERLTVGSLDPNILTDTFLKTIAGIPSFLPHLHLSIQSGSSKVLALMKRKYNADAALEKILKTKEVIPDIALSADIIVGFPGESDEDFSETVEFCKKVGFTHLHVFPYSERKGTPAAEMEGKIPEKIRKERAARLSEVASRIKSSILDSYIEKYGDGGDGVLFEQRLNGINIGHSRHYIEVRVPSEEDFSNKVLPVTLTSHNGEICFAKPLKSKKT